MTREISQPITLERLHSLYVLAKENLSKKPASKVPASDSFHHKELVTTKLYLSEEDRANLNTAIPTMEYYFNNITNSDFTNLDTNLKITNLFIEIEEIEVDPETKMSIVTFNKHVTFQPLETATV